MVCFMNAHTFAAMDFGRRLGASDEHIPKVDLSGASKDASAQKTRRPEGCSEFGLWLRCSVGRVSLRIHPPRASPQAKPPLCKLYSILPSGEYVDDKTFISKL